MNRLETEKKIYLRWKKTIRGVCREKRNGWGDVSLTCGVCFDGSMWTAKGEVMEQAQKACITFSLSLSLVVFVLSYWKLSRPYQLWGVGKNHTKIKRRRRRPSRLTSHADARNEGRKRITKTTTIWEDYKKKGSILSPRRRRPMTFKLDLYQINPNLGRTFMLGRIIMGRLGDKFWKVIITHTHIHTKP